MRERNRNNNLNNTNSLASYKTSLGQWGLLAGVNGAVEPYCDHLLFNSMHEAGRGALRTCDNIRVEVVRPHKFWLEMDPIHRQNWLERMTLPVGE